MTILTARSGVKQFGAVTPILWWKHVTTFGRPRWSRRLRSLAHAELSLTLTLYTEKSVTWQFQVGMSQTKWLKFAP